jgi:hypothetical protein
LLWLVRHHDLDLSSREEFRVKRGLHREARPEEREPAPAGRDGHVARRFDYAQHRNGGTALHLIEHEVWSVSRKQSQVGASMDETFHFARQIIGEL